jgi:formamidopyrimidine-DNA glycosylase
MEGATIASVTLARPDLRFPLPHDFAGQVTGRTIQSVGRRAKYLLIELDPDPVIITHLGMTGSFRIEDLGGSAMPGVFHHERSKDAKHDHVEFLLTARGRPDRRVVFNDPRRFGFMLLSDHAGLATHKMLVGLGVEPTGNSLDGAMLAGLLAGRKTPLKSALLDQRLIAGLGNIYVSEALWRARLSPKRLAGTIAGKGGRRTERSERLAEAIRSVIADAIAAGGSSLRDYVHADGSLGYFQHHFDVYDREGKPCRREGCGGTITRVVQAGRSTFYCPACQH